MLYVAQWVYDKAIFSIKASQGTHVALDVAIEAFDLVRAAVGYDFLQQTGANTRVAVILGDLDHFQFQGFVFLPWEPAISLLAGMFRGFAQAGITNG